MTRSPLVPSTWPVEEYSSSPASRRGGHDPLGGLLRRAGTAPSCRGRARARSPIISPEAPDVAHGRHVVERGREVALDLRAQVARCARPGRRRAAARSTASPTAAPSALCDHVNPCTNPLRRDGLVDLAARRREPERHVAAGGALAGGEDVRPDAPVVDAEPRARAAEPGHDLVGDHQDAVRAADLDDRGPVVVAGHRGAERRAGDGLRDEGRHGVGAVCSIIRSSSAACQSPQPSGCDGFSQRYS